MGSPRGGLSAPPDIEGRSKRIWLCSEGVCVVELIPSLRSYTYGREELVPATAKLRLDFYERASRSLKASGVPTVFRERLTETSYLADYAPASPFEVIIKNRSTGSTVRKYPGLFPEGHLFDPPVVKFDFRIDPEDEPISEDYLRAYGVPVEDFRRIARECNACLQSWVTPLELWDFCLIIGQDKHGALAINSEISPDCMRLRDAQGNSMDKDLFRQGANHERIIEVWSALVDKLPA